MIKTGFISKCAMFAVALFALSTAACTRDDSEEVIEPITYRETGTTFLKVHPWGRSVSIPLPAVPFGCVPEFEFSGKYFDWELQQDPDSGLDMLLLTLKQGVEKKAFLEKVPVLYNTSDGSSRHTLYIVAQPDEEDIPEADVPRYQRYVGMSVNVTDAINSSPIEQFLDFDLLHYADEITRVSTPRSWATHRSGMSYEEATFSMFEQFGFDVKTPNIDPVNSLFGADAKSCFSVSFDQTFDKNTARSNKFEYEIAYYDKAMIELHINTMLYVDGSADDFLSYMTDDAADLLNNPKSSLYQRYDNSEQDIYKMYDRYGTHLLVGGIFGGAFSYMYSRKANCYFEEIGWSVAADIADKKASGPANNWMQSYLNTLSANGISLGAGGGEHSSNYSEYLHAESKFYITGGNLSTDYTAWDASITDDQDNLAIVSYASRNSNSDTRCYLIPLYRLVTDIDRRNAMMQHLAGYIEHKKQKVDESKLVVADFMMHSVEDGHKYPVTYRKMEDPDGKERVYFPLVANLFVPNSDGGFMLDTSSDDYIVGADNRDQLWWVALDFADECKALTHICFLSKEENAALGNKYILRGESAERGIALASIDPNYVGIKRVNEFGSSAGAITGVALSRRSDDGEYYVIASSPGTDMLKPYNEESSQKQFHRYWGSFNAYSHPPYKIGTQSGSTTKWNIVDSWFGKTSSGVGNGDNWILPAYTMSKISYPLVSSGANRNFQVPDEY